MRLQKKTRFIEKDLNRCFASKNIICYEEKRAVILSKLLQQTEYFLDFHQTIEPSNQAFFVFPYSRKSLDFAMSINTSTNGISTS